MTPTMKSRISLSLLLTVGLSTLITSGYALATPIPTKPLPHDRDVKNFDDSEELAPVVSRFKRRPDYREAEKQKQEEADEAKKQAVENANKARTEQITSVKKREEAAVAANNRGVAMGQQRRWLEAISAHEQAVQLEPSNKQFRINLSAARTAYGQEKLAAGDLNSAANLFRKALAAAQDNGMAGKLLVQTLKKQGRDPSNVDTRLEIGDQLAATGDIESAVVEYQAAMQLEPSAKTYTKMGDMAFRYGQYSTAANWYTQAIAKDPSFGAAHRQLGFLQMALRDNTDAAASLRKAVVLDPHDVAAGSALVQIWRRQVATNPLLAENHLGLAGALQLTGDFVGADSEYRKLQALDPKNPGLEAGIESLSRARRHAEAEHYREAAETLYNQGLQREALAQISRAVQMEPRNARYQFIFAECLEASGDLNGAHQAYLTCVLLDPEHNAEAAARMKQMQRSAGGSINVGQQAAAVASQLGAPQYSASQMQAPAAVQPPLGAAGAAYAPGYPQAQQQYAPPQAAAIPVRQPIAAAPQPSSTAGGAFNDALSHVTDLESQKNYDDAIALLRQIVNSNLQNAEVHHRLAVDLLAAGQIDEAISEFRMASALQPEKKEYAGDLARAMAIHKRSLDNESSVASTTEVAK